VQSTRTSRTANGGSSEPGKRRFSETFSGGRSHSTNICPGSSSHGPMTTIPLPSSSMNLLTQWPPPRALAYPPPLFLLDVRATRLFLQVPFILSPPAWILHGNWTSTMTSPTSRTSPILDYGSHQMFLPWYGVSSLDRNSSRPSLNFSWRSFMIASLVSASTNAL
jgi:hypothetical protein